MATQFSINVLIKALDNITGPLGRITGNVGRFARGTSQVVGGVTSKLTSLKSLLIGGAMALGARKIWQGFEAWTKNADEIQKMSFQIGLTGRELQRYRFAAEMSGIATAGMEKSIGIMSRQMGQARLHAGKLYGELSKRAPGLLKQAIATKSNAEALDLFIRALDQTKDPAERAALAQVIFGKSGGAMIRMVKEGYPALKALTDEAERYGLLTDKAGKDAEEFDDSLTRLKYAANGLKNTLGAQALPVLIGWVKQATAWVNVNRDLVAGKVIDFVRGLYGKLTQITAWVAANKDTLKATFTTGLETALILGGAIATIVKNLQDTVGASAAAALAFGAAMGVMSKNPELAALAAAIVGIVEGLKYIDNIQVKYQNEVMQRKTGAPRVFRSQAELDKWTKEQDAVAKSAADLAVYNSTHSVTPDPLAENEEALADIVRPKALENAGRMGFSVQDAPGVSREVEVPIRLIVNSDKLPEYLGVRTEREVIGKANVGLRMGMGYRH